MPSLLDSVWTRNALRDRAGPILDALSMNPDLLNRSLRRFERDDPPPYTSSTESEEGDYFLPQSGPLPPSIIDVMTPPLSSDELEHMVILWNGVGQPHGIFETEFDMEVERVEQYLPSWMYTGGPEAHAPHRIIARHIIKRRWEKIGVWNSAWGIPGRLNSQSKDNPITWKWWWDPQEYDGAKKRAQSRLQRAVFLRQNLRRGESNLVPPRSHLEHGADIAQAESFLISRPWYTKMIEEIEECERWDRIPRSEQLRYEYNYVRQVREWWKERGDLRDGWEERGKGQVISWKWRHESPSPEPEELTAIEGLNKYELLTANFDFTGSEIDALEEFNASSPRNLSPIRPSRPYVFDADSLFRPLDDLGQESSQEEVEELPPSENEDPVYADPIDCPGTLEEEQRELLPRQRRRLVKAGSVPENSHPLRRSVRIANMKRKAEDSSLPSPPSKRTRNGKATAKAHVTIQPAMAPEASKPRLHNNARRRMPGLSSATRHERGRRPSKAGKRTIAR